MKIYGFTLVDSECDLTLRKENGTDSLYHEAITKLYSDKDRRNRKAYESYNERMKATGQEPSDFAEFIQDAELMTPVVVQTPDYHYTYEFIEQEVA